METFRCIGLMSGSSMDAADVCMADFFQQDKRWKFNIIRASDFPYPAEWKARLQSAHRSSAEELLKLDADLGKHFAQLIKPMVKESDQPVFVAGIHGHTVYHNPAQGISFQAGHGGIAAQISEVDCVTDFRVQDMVWNGQGAPLVPGGEAELFPQFGAFLNLGGISNISLMESDFPLAFDACPCNRVLDELAASKGMAYDAGGKIAQKGTINSELLQQLLQQDYFRETWPKSLGNQWARENIFPILQASALSVEDKMATAVEWIATVISNDLNLLKEKFPSWEKPLLVSGGGAKNPMLLQKIETKFHGKLSVADPLILQYKEALIFGFLAMLRKLRLPNVLPTATGSSRPSVSGALYSHG